MNARANSLSLILMVFAVLCTGCKPAFYRQRADEDASCLINGKSAAVGLEPGKYPIYVDPRSRMYDPYDPDREPMPPDDPVSHRLMECVDGKKGEKYYKTLPKTQFVENPGWLEHLPWGEDGRVLLDLEGTVSVALVNSPDYQRQLEELYLSALDVSFERFRFDTQFFGGSSVFYTADGRDRTGDGESSSLLEVSPSRSGNVFRAEKLTATGGELAVGMANSLVWQFAGPDDYAGFTFLDFSLLQPLLRASGRGRVLERLTISERSLLSNVRQMERYRRGFYLNVATGNDPGPGPSRRGGFFGGSGLEGFSGVGGGGFGRVGGGGGGGQGGGGGNTGGAGAQGAGGYLGLLQTAQVLRNQRSNVNSLRDSVLQLEASYDAGRIDRFQVDLARQALYNAQSQLLTQEAAYLNNLENFKVSIGLPPELPVTVRDPMLDRLNLLDPQLEQLQEYVTNSLLALREYRAAREEGAANAELRLPNLGGEQPDETAQTEQATLADFLTEAAEIQTEVGERLATVAADFEYLYSALPQRREYLANLSAREEVVAGTIDANLFSIERLDERVERRRTEFANLEQELGVSLGRLAQLTNQPPASDEATVNGLITSLTQLSGHLLELSLVQASVRLEAISFQPINLTPEQALAIASVYRRDWQNARASLVDAWRLIYFNANDLQSDLDLVFSGDIGNQGDNPFDLRSSNGRLRVGLEFDAPLTRLSERNVYRQALIEYQQARRTYYQFRDRVYQGLRSSLRQVRLNELNFELRRAAIETAITQVDLTQLRLSEPPQPGAVDQFNNTTARDLVQSLSDLLNVQNDFLSVWVNYEVQRLGLEFNLGVMELTPQGTRLENNMPLEAYLVGLPINSEDLGLAAEGCMVIDATELGQPEGVTPLPRKKPAEVLPPPVPVPAVGGAARPRRSGGEVVPASFEVAVSGDAANAEVAWNHQPQRLPPVDGETAHREKHARTDNVRGRAYNGANGSRPLPRPSTPAATLPTAALK